MNLQNVIAFSLIIAVFGAFAWLAFLSRKKGDNAGESKKK